MINISEDSGPLANVLPATSLDAGSHDYQCGPVDILVARLSEIELIDVDGALSVSELMNCSDTSEIFDRNFNGLINREELFRPSIRFCCQDIGREITLVVHISDQFGNFSEAEITILVDSKLDFTTCDDGNPCTIDDRMYESCGCMGTPSSSDIDQDNILDCMDNDIIVCLNGVEHTITFDEVEEYLQAGGAGGPCNGGQEIAAIGGEVFTRLKDMIEDVEISNNEDLLQMTTAHGEYMFDDNPMYETYILSAEKDGDDINGVSTLDLVRIQEHILGQRELTDPYLLIAADVNNDGRITALDLVDIRRLLLGHTDEFENNKSWRFVLESFEFNDIRNPFNYEEINVIENLSSDMMHENWIGVKIGDVTDNAVANTLKAQSRDRNDLVLIIENHFVTKDQEVTIPINIETNTEITGLQLRLELRGLEFVQLRSGLIKYIARAFRYSQ